MSTPRLVRSILILTFFALSVAPLSTARTAPSGSIDSKMAPAFELPTKSGNVTLDSLRGKVVLIDFWASWCAPCRQSFPWMIKLYDQYSAKGLAVVAINLDKKRELADDFLSDFSPPFVIAFDPSGKTAEAFNVPAMPSSYILNRDGTILYSHAGFDPKKTGEIENLIKEACSK
jgi:thiol-disulfide isomerase/thioredoxin